MSFNEDKKCISTTAPHNYYYTSYLLPISCRFWPIGHGYFFPSEIDFFVSSHRNEIKLVRLSCLYKWIPHIMYWQFIFFYKQNSHSSETQILLYIAFGIKRKRFHFSGVKLLRIIWLNANALYRHFDLSKKEM